jgi:hypothetical protein
MVSNSWQYMCDYLDGKIPSALKNIPDEVKTDIMCTYVERSLVGTIQGVQYHLEDFSS